jgi:hypothetical protein
MVSMLKEMGAIAHCLPLQPGFSTLETGGIVHLWSLQWAVLKNTRATVHL